MAIGFILISCKPGKERLVYEELTKDKRAVELTQLMGDWDLIVKAEDGDFNKLGEYYNEVRRSPNVFDTKYLTAITFSNARR